MKMSVVVILQMKIMGTEEEKKTYSTSKLAVKSVPVIVQSGGGYVWPILTTVTYVNSWCHQVSHLGVFLIFLLFVGEKNKERNLYSVHWTDLFGTWDSLSQSTSVL